MATTGRGLLMLKLMPNPGGTDITDILHTVMATMGRGLLMLSPLLMLRPNPGGMETMDTTATLLTAMATMERDLLMPSLLQMPSLGGMEAMAMAGPTVSIGANLTNNRNYWQEIPQNNTHQTEPNWIIAESKNLITKRINITILALSYCYVVSSPRLCSFIYFTI